MTDPDTGTPKPRPAGHLYAIIGFVAGVMTVITVVWLWNHVLH
jgi:hypothetical protein